MVQHTSSTLARQSSTASPHLSPFFVRLLLIGAIATLCVLAGLALIVSHVPPHHAVGAVSPLLADNPAPNVMCPGAPIHC